MKKDNAKRVFVLKQELRQFFNIEAISENSNSYKFTSDSNS
jgi:hypothetical protein